HADRGLGEPRPDRGSEFSAGHIVVELLHGSIRQGDATLQVGFLRGLHAIHLAVRVGSLSRYFLIASWTNEQGTTGRPCLSRFTCGVRERRPSRAWLGRVRGGRRRDGRESAHA